jgi:hypothetical protein
MFRCDVLNRGAFCCAVRSVAKYEWLNISFFHHRALVENGANTWTIMFWKVIISKALRKFINLAYDICFV